MEQRYIDSLTEICGKANVFYEMADIERYLYDETEEYVRPKACEDCIVVRPGTYEEVSEILKWANKELVPVIPRGGGTGACGAAIPTEPSVIMSMERFRKIVEVDETNMMITCQTGVTLASLNEYLAKNVHALYFPCHPGDEGAQVGGMCIENAGGVRAVKHGIMRSYIKGMKVCLPNGDIVQLGGKLMKNNMGYDLLHLLIGSEGTLAVVLEATLKLYPRLEYTGALVCSFNTTEDAVKSVGEVQKAGIIPLAVEYMDRAISVGTAEHIERTWPMKDEGKVDLLYLVEEATEDALYETAGTIAEICENNGAVGYVIAEDSKQQRNLLDIRSAIYEVYKPVFVDSLDTAVPVANIGDLLKEFDAIAEKYGTTTPRFGHVADGNFHNFILMVDGKVPEWADDMRRDIYKAAIKYGGTITAEHGTGKTRKPYMNLQYTPHVLGIMKSIKKAFDPNNILNPGVIIDLDD